jgi:hypothetical protein
VYRFAALSYNLEGEEAMIMIELTEQQSQALAGAPSPPLLVDPSTKTPYVLLRQDVYERLLDKDYDDNPWTDEELELLAWEAGKQAGWEDMDDYDNYPEKQ